MCVVEHSVHPQSHRNDATCMQPQYRLNASTKGP